MGGKARREQLHIDRRTATGGAIGLATAALVPSASFGSQIMDAERSTVATREGLVFYRELGTGPAALFLHAWPLNSIEWRGVLPPLAKHRRCIAPDLLGLGSSITAASTVPTPEVQVRMLSDLLDALHLRDVDLVANDTGAMIAMLFAASFPQRVRSVLLSNCDAPGEPVPAKFAPLVKAAEAGKLVDLFVRPQLADNSLARSGHGLGAALSRTDVLTSELVASYFVPLIASEERIEKFHELTVSLGGDHLEAVVPSLRRLEAPVKILWGTDDTLFSPGNPSVLDRLFPNSRGVRRIPGANLYLPEDRPDVFVEEALALWKR